MTTGKLLGAVCWSEGLGWCSAIGVGDMLGRQSTQFVAAAASVCHTGRGHDALRERGRGEWVCVGVGVVYVVEEVSEVVGVGVG